MLCRRVDFGTATHGQSQLEDHLYRTAGRSPTEVQHPNTLTILGSWRLYRRCTYMSHSSHCYGWSNIREMGYLAPYDLSSLIFLYLVPQAVENCLVRSCFSTVRSLEHLEKELNKSATTIKIHLSQFLCLRRSLSSFYPSVFLFNSCGIKQIFCAT